MRRGDDDVLVELVELDETDAVAPAGPADGGAPRDVVATDGTRPDRRRRRLLVGAAVAVVVLVAATLATVAALDARRKRARWDALADQGAALVDLAVPLEEAWHVDGDATGVTATSDVVVLAGQGGTGLSAHATASGELVWRQDLAAVSCTTAPGDGSGSGEVLVCMAGAYPGGLPDISASTRVTTYTVADGAALATVAVGGSMAAAATVDGDLVLASVGADGHADLARVDLVTGSVRWSVDTDQLVVSELGGLADADLTVEDDVVLLWDRDGVPLEAFDAATGDPRDVPAAPPRAPNETVLADGTVLRVDGEAMTTTVVDSAGDVRFTHAGLPWLPEASDGSAADVVVLAETLDDRVLALVAVDTRDGTQLWRRGTAAIRPRVQVDGLVVAGGASTVGLDLRTGDVRWHSEVVVPYPDTVTDGTRVLGLLVEGGESFLVALDVGTGEEAWRVPTVRGAYGIAAVPGGVVVNGLSTTAFHR